METLLERQYTRDNFIHSLSYKPFCTNDFDNGLYKKKRNNAITHQYIQYNDDAFISSLVFDIDNPLGALAWEFCGLPKPNIITQNTSNGHAHLLYALKKPVCKTDAGKVKPLQYLAMIENGMRKRLDADFAYSGLITKNPLNQHWRTFWNDQEPYELHYLRDFLDEDISISSNKEIEYGLGRNVELFNIGRKYAYKIVLKYKEDNNYELFYYDLFRLLKVENLNKFAYNLLIESEIKSICNSICKWTWRNFSKEVFSAIQSKRAKKPRKSTLKKLQLIQEMDGE